MKKLSWPHRCWREWSKIINAFTAVISLVVVMMIARPVCAAERQVVHVHMPAAAARLQPLGPMGSSQPLNLAVSLPLRNQEALANLLQQIYDPASPNYHHFLTPEQFTERFGPTEQDYQAVIAFARANGLTVSAEHPNRLLVDVSGSVADIERVLHVRMQVYQHPTENRTFYAPDVEPSLDLAVPILSISGLNNYSLPRPRLKNIERVSGQTVVPNAGSGPGGTYMGKDFRAAYAPDTTLDGSGQVVGLLQFDGYAASDITYYESQAGLPSVTLSNVLIDGASGLPSGSGGEVEVSLDIEMVISMATNVSQVIVYEAPNPSPFVDILNRMATDNLAKQLSCSWYVPNGTAEPAAEQIWQEMAAQGQSFFNASGDNDAYTGLIDFPGDSTNITQVGGTTLTTSGAGGAWASETVWNWGNGIGSGGGISTQYPIPYWQTNINMTANQGSTTMRNTPDVALTADKVYVRADGNNYNVGGTSCAAPLWAGFAALVNQQAAATGEPAVGFINPAVDAIGSGPNYATCFHDITTGNNTSSSSPAKFYAVTGYDLCTGWGTPNGQKLINALANPEALQIIPTTGFTSMGGVGGPFTVTSENFSLTNVGTNSLTWTLSNTSLWLNASSSGGALAWGGPATNVMISLNSVASNLLVGTYQATVWFTNLNDRVGQGRQFTLAVLSPPAITQQPTNQAVLDGATATFSVEVTGGMPLYYQWQFNSNNLTDGGNISGSTTTNLVIGAASLSDAGDYDVIVSNAAGVVISTNALLTIVPSRPVIIQQPTDETVVVKGTAQFTVAALGTKPFSYQWSFNETNIDGAINATLVLTNVQFDQAGAYAVVITNIHGSTLSSNANLTVTPCDPAPSGLVSWWKAEGNALDEMGGNNGTLVGNVSYGPGEVGQAFVLSAAGSGVAVGSATNLWLQDFTIECWIQRASTAVSSLNFPDADLFAFGQGGYGIGINYDGSLFLTQVGVGNVTVSTAVTDTNWHHLAVSKSGSTVIFYVDGVAYPAGAYDPGFVFNTSAAVGARGDYQLQDNSFYGSIDEMSVYNRGLSAQEIQSIYLAGSAGKCVPELPPAIVAQPTNQTVVMGQTAEFSVTATGTQPLSYQWTFDTTNIAGGTNATLVLTNVQFDQAGAYAVVITNIHGSTLSSNANLTVTPCDPAPSGLVSWWKAEGNALDEMGGNNGTLVGNVSYGPGEVGQAFVLSAAGSGVAVGSATNLWLQDFTIECWIQRASTAVSSLNFPDADLFAFGQGGYGIGINYDGSLFLTQVGVGNVTVSTAVTDTNWHHLAVSKSGSTVIFYVDGVAYPAGAYDPGFVFNTSAAVGARGDYQLQDNSFYGSIDEMSVYNRGLSAQEIQSIYLAGSAGKCVPELPPAIVAQPTNQTVVMGQTAEFSVTATGTQPLSYQWTFDTTNIAGGTNATLVLTNVQFDQAGAYAVVITNIHGSTLSSNANLTVTPCDPAPSGLVSWWKAEGNALDEMGGNNGTLVGNVSYGPGEVGQAFVLSAAGSGVAVGSATNLWLQDFTIECWIQRASTAVSSLNFPDADLFAFGQGGYGIGINYDGSLFLTQVGVGNVTVSTAVTDTNWHHLAVSKSGSTVIFYVDGVAYPAGAYDPGFVFNTSAAVGARGDYQLQDNSFYGSIDEMSVYNRGLSAQEIQSIYLAGSAGKCVPELPPAIVAQPTNQTVVMGQTAEFSVTATGTQPLSYQWTFDTTNIAGGTNATLVLTNVQFDQAGAYAVVITNIHGSTLSSNANLTVTPCDPAPSGLVSWWKAEGNALDEMGGNNGTLVGNVSYGPGEVGQAFVLSAAGSGVAVGSATNLWLQDFTIECWIQRASTAVSSLNFPDADLFAFGQGGYGIGINYDGSLFLTQVGVGNVTVSTAVTDTNWHHLAVSKSGSTVIFYVDGVAYPAGAYDPGFVFNTSAAVGARGDYQLQDNSFYGSIDEMSVYNRGLSAQEIQSIYLAGSAGKCVPELPPAIVAQPTNQTVVMGQTAEFSVTATGTQPLSYQWTFDTTNIAGGTNATLVLTNVQPGEAGTYAVMVSNIVNAVLSSNVTLTVLAPAAIITQPTNRTVYIGGTASFSVTASGTLPLRYQWNFNQTNIANATNTTLVLTNAQLNQAGNYVVLVTNLVNSVLSSNAVLTVNPPPTLGVTTSGGFVLIFWPVNMPGFVLETSSSLSLANWIPVPNPPIQIGSEYLESLQMTGTNQFFRLQLGE